MEGRENTAATLAPLFSAEEMGQLMHLLSQPENPADTARSLADYIEKIQTERLKRDPEQHLRELYKLK